MSAFFCVSVSSLLGYSMNAHIISDLVQKPADASTSEFVITTSLVFHRLRMQFLACSDQLSLANIIAAIPPYRDHIENVDVKFNCPYKSGKFHGRLVIPLFFGMTGRVRSIPSS
jgi:hypothetical protein